MIRGFILIFSISILCSCKSEDPLKATTPTTLRQVRVDIETTANGIALPQVEIFIYKTEDDRLYNKDEVLLGETDSLGKLNLIYYVSTGDSSYYHFVKALHPVYGEKLDEINTPPGSITQLSIDY